MLFKRNQSTARAPLKVEEPFEMCKRSLSLEVQYTALKNRFGVPKSLGTYTVYLPTGPGVKPSSIVSVFKFDSNGILRVRVESQSQTSSQLPRRTDCLNLTPKAMTECKLAVADFLGSQRGPHMNRRISRRK